VKTMPPITSRAIILQRRDFRETSVIANFFTRSHGKVAGVLKGVKNAPLRKHVIVEPLTLVDLTFYPKKKSQIFIVGQLDIMDFYLGIRKSLEKIIYAMYSIELLDQFTEFEAPNSALFDLATQVLTLSNDNSADARVLADIFQTKLLEEEGFLPSLEQCAVCGHPIQEKGFFSTARKHIVCDRCRVPRKTLHEISQGTISTIAKIKDADVAMMKKIKMTHSTMRELETFLLSLVTYAIGKQPKTLKSMESVLNPAVSY